jgi:hypothetical protein
MSDGRLAALIVLTLGITAIVPMAAARAFYVRTREGRSPAPTLRLLAPIWVAAIMADIGLFACTYHRAASWWLAIMTTGEYILIGIVAGFGVLWLKRK